MLSIGIIASSKGMKQIHMRFEVSVAVCLASTSEYERLKIMKTLVKRGKGGNDFENKKASSV